MKICDREPAGWCWRTRDPSADQLIKHPGPNIKEKDKEVFLNCPVCVFLDAELLSVLTTGYKL